MPHQISPELFISFIPGSRLEDEIDKVIDYCEQNNCLSQLEFNAKTNWISQYSNKDSLSNDWFNITTTKEDILAQIRDKKLDSILSK
jgi:SOS response regulatory protein OraA/RecX